jgi:AcrR family transcriptional regulator
MAPAGEKGKPTLEERAVEAALAIAAERGWDQVRLDAIATATGLPLVEIGRRFRDVDAVANAWFVQARLAMLAVPREAFADRPAGERIALAFNRWLDALAPHRRIAAEIIRHKLYPSHPHHWVPLLFDLSRLVHDLLDVAQVEGSGRLRQAQEIGLTGITLHTLADWLQDESPGQGRSRDRLRQRLARAGHLVRLMQRAQCAASLRPPGRAWPSPPSGSSPGRSRGSAG